MMLKMFPRSFQFLILLVKEKTYPDKTNIVKKFGRSNLERLMNVQTSSKMRLIDSESSNKDSCKKSRPWITSLKAAIMKFKDCIWLIKVDRLLIRLKMVTKRNLTFKLLATRTLILSTN